MQADFKVVLDACVLASIAVCDLFLLRWSTEILDETRRVQSGKLNWPENLVESWRRMVTHAFPDAVVDDYDHFLEKVTNHEKDRHVLAATIRSGASVRVTFNLRDFPEDALAPWGTDACHPQD